MNSNFATTEQLEAIVYEAAPKHQDDAQFKPVVYHNVNGDCIEFIFSPEDYFSERVDGFLTVLIGNESGEIVGSIIKGVSTRIRAMLEQNSRVNVEICDGKKLKLAHLFFEPEDASNDQPSRRIVYYRLKKVAERINAVADIAHLV